MVDPQLASVTHVIVDEVHERGLEVSWGCKWGMQRFRVQGL
jgi:hypothetical protein